MNSTTACTPDSGWCLIRIYTPVICSEFDYFSDNFLKLACRSLYISEKRSSCFGVPFLPSIRIFLSALKWFLLILPRSLFTIVYTNSFEKLIQDICPFCISFICLHFLYQLTDLKFPHLPFGCQNPSSWKMSLSQVILSKSWQTITMSNYFSEFALFCFALYNFYIPP